MTKQLDEGQVAFKVGEREYVLEITNRTERAIQKRFKKPMGEVIKSLGTGDVEVLLGMFYESLKTHQPDVKEDDVLDLVKPRQLREHISELLAATYPDKEDPPVPGQVGETGSANSEPGSS